MGLLNKEILEHLYITRGLSDHEIGTFVGLDRSQVSHLRKRFGISSRVSLGEIGEQYVKTKLELLGFRVKDMNEEDKKRPFDLLVNEKIRIEVKSAACHKSIFKFQLAEKAENQNVESETRIRLGNGRTKKLFRNTCDFVVFVGFKGKKAYPLIIPSSPLK